MYFQIMLGFFSLFFWLHSMFTRVLTRLCFTSNFLFLKYEPDWKWLLLSSCKPIQFTIIKLRITGVYRVYSNWRFFLSCGKIPKWDVSRFGHQTLRPGFVQHFAHLPWAWDIGTFVKHSSSKCSKPDLETPADLNSIYLIPLFRIWV